MHVVHVNFQIFRTLHGMTHFFEQQAPRPQQDMYDQFRRLSTKKFSGTTNPFAAESWIRSFEVHFHYLNMGDADQVRCATYMLRDYDFLWWEGDEHGVNLATLIWVQFKNIFYEKYLNTEVCGRLKRKFMTLLQGETIVAEFVRRFDRGCHFVPFIARDAAEKMRHFMDGL
ncbi:uncharacterized protein LOC142550181 [Primulina tabacum]|uniref:uncharacterized protein LOC142550181 n=1 Tax=Primulina tabacum TaxID=48773 RepID=UPI003F595047